MTCQTTLSKTPPQLWQICSRQIHCVKQQLAAPASGSPCSLQPMHSLLTLIEIMYCCLILHCSLSWPFLKSGQPECFAQDLTSPVEAVRGTQICFYLIYLYWSRYSEHLISLVGWHDVMFLSLSLFLFENYLMCMVYYIRKNILQVLYYCSSEGNSIIMNPGSRTLRYEAINPRGRVLRVDMQSWVGIAYSLAID